MPRRAESKGTGLGLCPMSLFAATLGGLNILFTVP
jgi:hypothetical protein